MKFYGTPNLYVKISQKFVIRVTGIKGFYFDDKGEYKTENETLIKLLKQNFKYEVTNEIESNAKSEEIKPKKRKNKEE
jgi:hypothetical protein